MSEHQARFSGVLGEEYDLFGKSVSYHDELQDTVGNYIKEHTAVSERLTFIEAGVGTGITTVRILNANPSIVVHAIDNEPKTLNQAKEVLADFEGRVVFEEADILDALKARSNESVDGFVSAYLIHNLPPAYRAELFVEIARVLKKGGLFVNADKYALDDEDAHAKTLQEQLEAFSVYEEMGRPEVKEEWTKHYLEDEKIRFTESEQRALFEAHGFSNVERIFREGMDAIFVAKK